MIRFIVSKRNKFPIERLIKARKDISSQLTVHTYQSIFGLGKIPCGTIVFTDFDHLHSYELDAAAHIAHEVSRQRPDLKVLNHPGVALERFDLLDKLYKLGLNPVEVTRLSGGGAPTKYPLFIRSEDGAEWPTGELLYTQQNYDDFIARHAAEKRPLKRRIAVRFCSEKDKDGFYRKYGAFIFGDRVVSQHIMRNEDWLVKSKNRQDDEAFIKEEYAYTVANPHIAWIKEIAHHAGIEYGRIDYGVFNGELVVYEFNTNPTFPNLREGRGDSERGARKKPMMDQIADALRGINTDNAASKGSVRFKLNFRVANTGFIERDKPKGLQKLFVSTHDRK